METRPRHDDRDQTVDQASGQAEVAEVLRASDALVDALERYRRRLESRALPGFNGPLRQAEERLQALQLAAHSDDAAWDYRYMYRIARHSLVTRRGRDA